MQKPDYGIDAPGVIRNLFIFSIIGLAGYLVLTYYPFHFYLNLKGFFLVGFIICFLEAVAMLAYSRWGKLYHRDKMLKMHTWQGNEQVLDIGTGSGLLMVGAAKKLAQGKAIGIDIWSAQDLSHNTQVKAENNARLEGVSEKSEILNQDIRHTTFPSQSFDVILSNLCLHNIPDAEGRKQACQEIARLLKPGGEAIISDFKHNGQYEEVFRKLGLRTERKGPYYFSSFPPVSVIQAKKPETLA